MSLIPGLLVVMLCDWCTLRFAQGLARCGVGIYDLLALALELLPEVVRQSAGSFALCGRPLAVGCVVSVVALRDVALGRSSLGNTHSMFFVVVIFLDLTHSWSPLRAGCPE